MVCNETLSKGAANEDLRVQAQKRLDDVFDDIFSVHFVTKGFGYVCCGAQTPTLRGFSQGRNLFPLYGDSSWLEDPSVVIYTNPVDHCFDIH